MSECSFAFPPFNTTTTMSKQSSLLSFFGSKRQKVNAQFSDSVAHYRLTLLFNRLHHLRLNLLLQLLRLLRRLLLALLLQSVKKEIWTTLLQQQKTTMTNWIHRLLLVGLYATPFDNWNLTARLRFDRCKATSSTLYPRSQ